MTQSTTRRCIPDLSFDANPNTGVIIYDTYGGGGFFSDDRGVFQEVEGLDEFVTLQGVLATKTIGIGALLNFFPLE